jgi:hypothetical protein
MDLRSGFFCNISIDLNSQCKKAGTQRKAGAAAIASHLAYVNRRSQTMWAACPHGKSLFREGQAVKLKLTTTKSYSQIVKLSYERQ